MTGYPHRSLTDDRRNLYAMSNEKGLPEADVCHGNMGGSHLNSILAVCGATIYK